MGIKCGVVLGDQSIELEFGLRDGMVVVNDDMGTLTGVKPGTYGMIEIWSGGRMFELVLTDPIIIKHRDDVVTWYPECLTLTLDETRLLSEI